MATGAILRRISGGYRSTFAVSGTCVAAGVAITSAQSSSPGSEIYHGLLLVYLFVVWLPLFEVLITRQEHFQILVRCLIVGAVLTGGAAIAQAHFGVKIPYSPPQWGRMSGFTGNPDGLGTFEATILPLTLSAIVLSRTIPAKLAFLAAGVVIITALLLSASITGAACATVAVGVFGLLTIRRKRVFLQIGVVTILVALGIGAVWGRFSETPVLKVASRVTELHTAGVSNSTLGTRLRGDEEALRYINRRPLTGAGFNAALPGVDTLVHNSLLRFWYEGGMLLEAGLLIVLTVGTIRLASLWKPKTQDEGQLVYRAAVAGAYASFLLLSSVSPVMFNRADWLGLALIFALTSGSRSRTARLLHNGRPHGTRRLLE
ncbi:MAG TPA: O-antigen ligase family protein [Gammaproteobacteria bacterium]|nr:O-antigen ligase family protein [Gammaproteobacteria bacterium]